MYVYIYINIYIYMYIYIYVYMYIYICIYVYIYIQWLCQKIFRCAEIAHFCAFLCTILTNSVRNFYLLTRYTILDAKITHCPVKLCAIL